MSMELKRLSLWEFWLMEAVLLLMVWLISDYAGTLLSLILGTLFLTIWLISISVEAIEKSKVPRWYFRGILGAGLVAWVVFFIFVWIKGGDFDWLHFKL